MNCWYCERPSHGICRFCGRAVCRDHFQKFPFVLSVFPDQQGHYHALVVADTLYCGVCKPKEDPVRVPDLEKLDQLKN